MGQFLPRGSFGGSPNWGSWERGLGSRLGGWSGGGLAQGSEGEGVGRVASGGERLGVQKVSLISSGFPHPSKCPSFMHCSRKNYRYRKVQVYPLESGQQLVREPSKIGGAKKDNKHKQIFWIFLGTGEGQICLCDAFFLGNEGNT